MDVVFNYLPVLLRRGKARARKSVTHLPAWVSMKTPGVDMSTS
jgi:hypothetical protein